MNICQSENFKNFDSGFLKHRKERIYDYEKVLD